MRSPRFKVAALLPRGGSVPRQGAPRVVTEQHTAGMLETKPDGVSVRVLKSANWAEEGGFHTVGSWLRFSTANQEQIHVEQDQNDVLGCTAYRRGAGNETQAGSRSGLAFLGVDGLPLTGKPGSGGVFCPPRLSFVRPLRTLSTPRLQRHRADCSRRAHLGCTRILSRTRCAGSHDRPMSVWRQGIQKAGIQKAVDKPPVAGRSWQR